VNGSYLVLAGRIHRELMDLERLVARAERSVRQAKLAADEAYIDAAALNMHSFYGGMERLFELIANEIDESPLTGERWHLELLRRMGSEIPDVRPAVLRSETLQMLDEYRGFRHVVRNVYTFNFNPERVSALVWQLRPSYEAVRADLFAFAKFLEDIGKD
jgi:hypothetical protein